MRDKTKKFKFEVIADEVRKMILDGKLGGEMLPKEQYFIERFKVSRKTILRTMDLLVKEGLLRRVKGTGTFINLDSGKPIDLTHRMAAVAMPLSGHYYGTLYESVRKYLNANNLYPVSFNIDAGHFNELAQKTNLNTLLNSPIRGLILHGGGYWRNPWLSEHPNCRTVFVDYYDYTGTPPGAAVLVDYEEGFYEAAKHLAETSCKRLVLYTGPNTITIRMTDSHKSNHPLFSMVKGSKRAAKDFGMEFKWVTHSQVASGYDTSLEEIFNFKPDGVICMMDYLATKVAERAMQNGLSIPNDLRIVGNYDTIWCNEAPVALSSINPRPDDLGRIAVKLLLEGESSIVKLKPKLIIRKSSAVNVAKISEENLSMNKEYCLYI
jgi:GntR family transcriptional regulator of arabinose operon